MGAVIPPTPTTLNAKPIYKSSGRAATGRPIQCTGAHKNGAVGGGGGGTARPQATGRHHTPSVPRV